MAEAQAARLGRQQLPEQSSEQGPGRAGAGLPSVISTDWKLGRKCFTKRKGSGEMGSEQPV